MIKEERTQAVENCTRLELHSPGDLSVGDLCQAMFIEGARLLGYAGDALMPTEVQEQIFLAAVQIAEGLGLLLQLQQSKSCG